MADEEPIEEAAGEEGGDQPVITDPVTVYTARDYLEAQILRDILLDNGIDAFASDDGAAAGAWTAGLIPALHKPRVIVNRADRERALSFAEEFDAEIVAQQQAKRESVQANEGVITVTCDECGAVNQFPAHRRGGVEKCARCREFIDVE